MNKEYVVRLFEEERGVCEWHGLNVIGKSSNDSDGIILTE